MPIDTNKPPLIILCLDAGNPDFIERWTQSGYLPNLASIMQRGCWGKTGGAELICEHGAWVSIFSGISRGQHGYHDFRQLKPGTYELQTLTGADLNILPFWAHLQGRERQVAVIDVPDTHPLPGLAGIQVANWAIHNPISPPSTEPPELLQEVRYVFGQQMNIPEKVDSSFKEDRQIYRQLLQRVEKKGKLCRHLLKKDNFDLVVVVFAECHTGGHQFWKYRPEAPCSEKVEELSELTDGIRDIYQAIDREIGLMLEQLPSDANIFIVSSVGLHDQYPTGGLIQDFCRKLGYQAAPDPGSLSLSPMRLIRQMVPEAWRVAVSRHFPRATREKIVAEQFRSNTHWLHTIAFATPSTYTSLLRVNLRGREPEGIVEWGAEYEQVLQRLEADLAQLIDPQTGKPAVKKVTRSHELFGCNPLTSSLPDLFVEWQLVPYFMEKVIHPKVELVQHKPEFFEAATIPKQAFLRLQDRPSTSKAQLVIYRCWIWLQLFFPSWANRFHRG